MYEIKLITFFRVLVYNVYILFVFDFKFKLQILLLHLLQFNDIIEHAITSCSRSTWSEREIIQNDAIFCTTQIHSTLKTISFLLFGYTERRLRIIALKRSVYILLNLFIFYQSKSLNCFKKKY